MNEVPCSHTSKPNVFEHPLHDNAMICLLTDIPYKIRSASYHSKWNTRQSKLTRGTDFKAVYNAFLIGRSGWPWTPCRVNKKNRNYFHVFNYFIKSQKVPSLFFAMHKIQTHGSSAVLKGIWRLLYFYFAGIVSDSLAINTRKRFLKRKTKILKPSQLLLQLEKIPQIRLFPSQRKLLSKYQSFLSLNFLDHDDAPDSKVVENSLDFQELNTTLAKIYSKNESFAAYADACLQTAEVKSNFRQNIILATFN